MADYSSVYTGQQIDNLLGRISTAENNISSLSSTVSTLDSAVTNKEDKVTGKGLSTNDYTTAEKDKLGALPTNQQLIQLINGKQDNIQDLETIRSGAASGATAYQKPSGGVPKSDLESTVQTSLEKVDQLEHEIDYNFQYEMTPTATYPGKYLEDDGTMPDSSTNGATVKEYAYNGGRVLASGFSPSGSKTAVQYWAGSTYLSSEKFGETVGFTEEELTIPDGTTKIFVAGNNRNNIPNYPFAYSFHLAVDEELSGTSKNPVQNKAVNAAIDEMDYNRETTMVPVASYPGKYLENDGTMPDSSVDGAMVKEYAYGGGKVLASGFSPSGSKTAVQYWNGSTYISSQKFGETVGFTRQLLIIPDGTTKFFVAGNNRNGVPNQPYAYLIRLALDSELDINSTAPVQNKKVAGKIMYKNEGKTIGVFGGSHSVREESQAAKDLWRQKLNVTITDYGVSGAGFSSLQGTSIQTQVDGAASKDIYILWGSTNDFRNSRECGTWKDYTAEDSYDESKRVTQCGGINYCIKKLMTINPLAQIYFFLPMRFYSRDSGHNPFSTDTNTTGKTFWEYIEAMKECCEHYGIPVLDQFNFQGVNDFNYTNYFQSDELHLKASGYELIGWVQAEFLANGLA